MTASSTERVRRMRARRAQASARPIYYETDDWELFLSSASLPQKAGCQPGEVGHAVLKELVDNALDSGAKTVTLSDPAPATGAYEATIGDDGPGLDAVDIVRLFAVNRPLRSSKKVRRPLRGMLGNGLRVVMGAVAAFGGTIEVISRGHRLALAVDPASGKTVVISDETVSETPGLSVRIAFPPASTLWLSGNAFAHARLAITLVERGARLYTGPSLAAWYSPIALQQLIEAAPSGVKPPAVIKDAFGFKDPTASLDLDWCSRFISMHDDGRVMDVGQLGGRAFNGGFYRRVAGTADFDGAIVPFTVEVFAWAKLVDRDGNTGFVTRPYLNGSLSLARLNYYADSTGLRLDGCGIDIKVGGPKRADYTIFISVVTPYLQLTGDGKAPHLGPFAGAIEKALKDAAGNAYRNLVRPVGAVSIVDAAYQVMAEAYAKASDNGALPAKARQIMYAARGAILELTGLKKFSDAYFTQTLLPDYLQNFPAETAAWDVIYDARGHLVEPHTREQVALGTLQVRQYLGERPRPSKPQLIDGKLYPTTGPVNRYRNALFIEKEGFDELFEAVQLAERYDIAIMSTKGMSVVAARQLIDRIAPDVENILVMHDFDVTGFSILGTLGTDSRRYEFASDLANKVIDIGLRLDDIEEMGLDAETVPVKSREARRNTLERHGATEDEIEFLAPEDEDEDCRRVELNAMTSRQLVDFVEDKFAEFGVKKVIPSDEVITEQARRLIEHKLTRDLLAEHAEKLARKAADAKLPRGLRLRLAKLRDERPELPWDAALDIILHGE
jgi:hypothetical protein